MMPAAWIMFDDLPGPFALAAFGLPLATEAYYLIVPDGALFACTVKNEHGWTLTVTHTETTDLAMIAPGRLPTLDELRAARETCVPAGIIMAALLDRMTAAHLGRMTRTGDATTGPTAAGLSTTVRCVQVFVEGLTDDVVYGIEEE